MAYQATIHRGYGGIGAHDPQAVYTKPPATPADQVDYHAAAEWHICAVCSWSYLCHNKHQHGHPGCKGAA